MGMFTLWVLGVTFWHVWHETVPHAATMGAVGVAALVANALSFGLLWAYRRGDANMRSAWICTRNDVLGNLAVLLAALGVFGTGTGWPDVIVAAIMAGLALQGAWIVIRQSRHSPLDVRFAPASGHPGRGGCCCHDFKLQKRSFASCDMNSATANGVSSGRCSRTKHAAFPALTTGALLMASFGSCDLVHHGVICPRATVPIRLATIGLFAGGRLVFGTRSWMLWPQLMMRPCK